MNKSSAKKNWSRSSEQAEAARVYGRQPYRKRPMTPPFTKQLRTASAREGGGATGDAKEVGAAAAAAASLPQAFLDARPVCSVLLLLYLCVLCCMLLSLAAGRYCFPHTSCTGRSQSSRQTWSPLSQSRLGASSI